MGRKRPAGQSSGGYPKNNFTIEKLLEPTVLRKLRLEEFHLVGPDALAVDQRQVFGRVGFEGQGEQFHVRLFRRAVLLVMVAATAGGHHVDPGVGATA